MCETSATENGMETHEKLFTTESELNIINKRLRKGKKKRSYRWRQRVKLGPIKQFGRK